VTRPLTASDRQRLRTPAYLWRALIPLLVIVGLLVIFTWPKGQVSDGVHMVDTSGPIATARQQAGFAMLAPAGLSSDWRATSTELVPAGPGGAGTFRIGYVSPKGQYAEFLEGNDAPDAVSAQYGPLSVDGTTTIAGAVWQQYETENSRRLFRRTVGKVTVIVTGSASQTELEQLAASLR
jgi:hypothetical protein